VSSVIEETCKLVKDKNFEMVDFKVIDLIGRWYHITIPASQFGEKTFVDGIGLDASSYSGYKKVAAGDMKIIPDGTTAMLDPSCEVKTLSLICDIFEADGSPYSRYPRNVARKAEAYMSQIQKGKALFSPEYEFYIFDGVEYESGINRSFYYLDSAEAFWNTGSGEHSNIGYKFCKGKGYHGIPPADITFNLRSEMTKLIEEAGVTVKYHHHEVGGPGQVEIEVLHDTLLRSADAAMIIKYIVKNTAYRNQKVANFMPKPLYQEAGSGMHVHQYISDNGISLFHDPAGYSCLSNLALNYIGGLLKHGPALLALTNPSTNSYKRLVPGYEAPVNLFFAAANRTAAIRIPTYEVTEQGTRIEFRPPDATCNPYLALAAMLMAGLDGIEKNIDTAAEGFGPFEVDIAEIPEKEREKIKVLPTSLEDALSELKNDHDFLLKGGVFTEDLIDAWIQYKLENEVEPLRGRPHPYEFELYSDI